MATYQRTPEMPLMDGLRVKLLQILENNDSYLELSLLLKELIDDLVDLSERYDISVKKTVDTFERDDYLKMATLMHHIPKDVMRSILTGTVARDFQSANPPVTYTPRVCGTYICSAAIDGRNGRFLSNNEIDTLYATLNDYAAAGLAWLQNRSWDPQDPQHDLQRDLVRDIDAQCMVAKADGSPRWINNYSAAARVQILADMFKSRQDPQLDMANNGNTYHEQSPCMVGCTGQPIEERVKAHKPDSLNRTTYTWGLTLCVLRYMGLEPKVTAVPVIGTFEQADLPLSEQLVTVLAQSMVFQTGFNVIQAGGQEDTAPRGYEDQDRVMVKRLALRENLDRTLARIVTLRRDAEIEKNVRTYDPDDLKILQDKLEVAVLDFKTAMTKYAETREELKKQLKEMAEEKRRLKGQLEALKAEKIIREAMTKLLTRKD